MISKTLLAAGAVLALASGANATQFVQNGGFETSSYTSNTQFGSTFNNGLGVTGWAGSTVSNALQFYYVGGTQTSVNAVNQ